MKKLLAIALFAIVLLTAFSCTEEPVTPKHNDAGTSKPTGL